MARKSAEVRFGLMLPEAAREQLRKAGIFVQTVVTVEHQHLAHRYVVRGVESGGAVEGFGHYVSFAGEDGTPLRYVCRVESLAVNGLHAVVVAPALVRAEMLRVRNTYELLITRHRPGAIRNGKRPTLASELLFRGRHGQLAGREPGVPTFWSRAGEPMTIPERFIRIVSSLVMGTHCVPCDHAHFVMDPEETGCKALSAEREDATGEACNPAVTERVGRNPGV